MAETVLTAAPQAEPISLAEARLHLRIDDDNTADDALIQVLITAAREQAEHETGRRMITQTREMTLDAFPAGGESIQLHADCVKAQSIESITYLDTAGVWQTFNAASYALDPHTLPGYVFEAAGAAWPAGVSDSANAVRIKVVCGYGNAGSDVPQALRQWMLLQIGAMYAQRETFALGVPVAELPGRFVDRLLDPYRVYST
jgi:uncharacterized phiE125 gp8 family phage protein